MAAERGYLALAVVLAASLAGAALLMLPRIRPIGDAEPSAEEVPTAPPAGPAEPVATELPALPEEPEAVASASPEAAAEPGPPAAPPCPEGMSFVEGKFCPFLAHRCVERPTAPTSPERKGPSAPERRCRRFSVDAICEGRPSTLRFCVDRFEYPNIAGTKPVVLVDYPAAARACSAEGKRLCRADEWTFACEGAEGLPYPHGINRDSAACNIDRTVYAADARALKNPALVSGEIERIDGRTPSGALPRCVSPFGALDMSGNVAEWVQLPAGGVATPPFESSIVGGAWGRSEGTCRAVDSDYPKSYRRPDLGFRCCRDALDGKPARKLWPLGTRLPRRRKLPVPAGADTAAASATPIRVPNDDP